MEPPKYQKEEYLDTFITSVYNSYAANVKFLLKVQIFNNHIINGFKTIQDELKAVEMFKDIKSVNLKDIVNFLLHELIRYNNLFQLETKDEVIDIIEQYKEYIDEEQLLTLKEDAVFNPENFSIGELSIAPGKHGFMNQDINTIKTIISFVVPYKMNIEYISHNINSSTRVEFLEIKNLYEDCVYTLLDSAGLNANGMPITYLSDSIGNIGNTTQIHIVKQDFFHPDFEIIDGNVIDSDFEIEDAKHGGKYYPHKDLIIEVMFELFEKDLFPFALEKKDINSNFISNYIVTYKDKDNKLVHHKLFALTNLDSYSIVQKNFLIKMGKLYIKDDFLLIRDLVYNVEITSNRVFLDFCYKLLELTIKKSIEFSGLSKSLWTNKDGKSIPKKEIDAQAVLYNQIKDIAAIKGIKVLRETVAADGSLDFLFHYTKNDISMNVCVELKNAHHASLIHGIQTQLPLYIKDCGRREGIFLVLWYKSDTFSEPTKYASMQSLKDTLVGEVHERFNIKPLIIDCSPKISPSMRGSENRLTLETNKEI